MVRLSTQSGTAGLPVGVKSRGLTVDFKVDSFTIAVESKGLRLAWTRVTLCPCAGNNDQTQQPDINCAICTGTGWLEFAPTIAARTISVGKFNAHQTNLISTYNAGVIFGTVGGITGKSEEYDKIRRRLSGMVNVSVRPENKLSYYDRLVALDHVVPYAQLADADGTATTTLTYPAVDVNLIRSEATTFVYGTDYTITLGAITWLTTPPIDGTRLSIHYLINPHWRVIEHQHMLRATLVAAKTAKPTAPLGNPTPLPLQAIAQLEYLIE